MQASWRLALVVMACACAAAEGRSAPRGKQPRATRGFKNTEMMTARGFGKRTVPAATPVINELAGFPNTENFWDIFEAAQERGVPEQFEDKRSDSVPVSWFAEELAARPELARSVLAKFVDTNQDGFLSSEELARNY